MRRAAGARSCPTAQGQKKLPRPKDGRAMVFPWRRSRHSDPPEPENKEARGHVSSQDRARGCAHGATGRGKGQEQRNAKLLFGWGENGRCTAGAARDTTRRNGTVAPRSRVTPGTHLAAPAPVSLAQSGTRPGKACESYNRFDLDQSGSRMIRLLLTWAALGPGKARSTACP